MYAIEIPERLQGRKLGSILQSEFKMSRRLLRQLTISNGVTCNDHPVYLSTRAHLGDRINIMLPVEESDVPPEQMDLDIRFEDAEIVVVNKRPGVLTHPTARERGGSLIGGLRAYFGASALVPHAIHRLDRDTSGLVMMAKYAHTHHLFDIALRTDTIDRQYTALVYIANQTLAEKNVWHTIDLPIAQDFDKPSRRIVASTGQRAVTHIRMLERCGKIGVIQVKLETGRTHQIRLHMAASGLPLLGDRDYTLAYSGLPMPPDAESYSRFIRRQALHAYRLSWTHPVYQTRHVVDATPPADMTELWAELGGSSAVWDRLLSVD